MSNLDIHEEKLRKALSALLDVADSNITSSVTVSVGYGSNSAAVHIPTYVFRKFLKGKSS